MREQIRVASIVVRPSLSEVGGVVIYQRLNNADYGGQLAFRETLAAQTGTSSIPGSYASEASIVSVGSDADWLSVSPDTVKGV
jgi:hypothetical protein